MELTSCGTEVRLSRADGVRETGVWVEESGLVEGPAGDRRGSELGQWLLDAPLLCP